MEVKNLTGTGCSWGISRRHPWLSCRRVSKKTGVELGMGGVKKSWGGAPRVLSAASHGTAWAGVKQGGGVTSSTMVAMGPGRRNGRRKDNDGHSLWLK
jgi:hypothetical protein